MITAINYIKREKIVYMQTCDMEEFAASGLSFLTCLK